MNPFLSKTLLIFSFCFALIGTTMAQDRADILLEEPSYEVSSDPVPTCASVDDLAVTDVNSSSITFGWTNYASFSENYFYEFYNTTNNTLLESGMVTATNCNNNNNACNSITFDNLQSNITYKFRIKRICQSSPLLESNFKEINATTINPNSCDPLSGIAAYTTPTNITLTLYATATTFASYEVKLYQGTTLVSTKIVNANNNGVDCVFDSLSSCTPYYYTVKPLCSNGQANAYTTNVVSTKCCGNILTSGVIDENENGFTLQWSNDIKVVCDGFKVKIKQTDANNQIILTRPYDNINQLIINSGNFPTLVKGKKYYVTITPYCSGQSSNINNQVQLLAHTINPCNVPTVQSVTIGETQVFIKFLVTPPTSYDKKYTVKIKDANGNTIQTTQKTYLVGTANSGITSFSVQFNNLLKNTDYKFEVETECCYPNVQSTCTWQKNPQIVTQNFKTKQEVCSSPEGLHVKAKTDNSITVGWYNVPLGGISMKILATLYDDNGLLETKTIIAAGQTQSVMFDNCSPNKKYLIKLTAFCCKSEDNCENPQLWKEGGSTSIEITTDPTLSPLCGTESLTITVEQVGNKAKIIYQPSTVQLSPNGRRLLVSGPKGLHIIDDATNNLIDIANLVGTVSFTIKEVFDGQGTTYTTACLDKVITKTLQNPCLETPDISVACLGLKGFLFKPATTLSANATVVVRYRKLSQQVLITLGIDPQSECNSTSFSNIPINQTISTNSLSGWQSLTLVPNPSGSLIMNNLEPCELYELQVQTYIKEDNAEPVLCKTNIFQHYFHTLGVDVAIKDVNENSIDDDCEGFKPPKPDDKDEPIDIKDIICGETAAPAAVTGNPYTDAKINDVFKINEIPFKIVKIVSSGSNNYSGEGVMSVPFTDQKLKVEFSNITVIKNILNEKIVTAGTVKSMMDPQKTQISKVIDDINAKNLQNSKPFCGISDEIDENGFNKSGLYAKNPPYTGYSPDAPFDSKYSPQGFDKNGNTPVGKKYNDCHCDAKGNSEPGFTCMPNKCEPYYWIAEKNTTEEGRKLYDKVKNKLTADLLDLLEKAKIAKSDTLGIATTKSNGIRKTMEGLRTTLNYEKPLVFGANDAWISRGMSKYFEKTPIPFAVNMKRNDQHVLFEKTHIDLYFADLDEVKYSELIGIIDAIKETAVLEIFEKNIAYQIKSLPKAEAEEFFNSEPKFLGWLRKKIEQKIIYDYKTKAKVTIASPTIEDTDYLTNYKAKSGLCAAPSSKTVLANIGMMADNDDKIMNLLVKYQDNPSKLAEAVEENLQFEYEQGFDKIGGISRAHILESIFLKRKMSMVEINSSTALGTPLSKGKTETGKNQNVYFDNFVYTPTGATVDIYVIVNFKGHQQVFQVLKAPISLGGFDGNIKLGLASDFDLPLNNVAKITFKGAAPSINGAKTQAITGNTPSTEEGTYVVIGCDGFGGLNLDARIDFCRKYFIPLAPNDTEMPEPNMVQATLKLKVLTFTNFYLDNLSVTPFTLPKHKDFKFYMKDVVLDFSDTYTPNIVKFPNNYVTDFSKVTAGTTAPTPQWKGFYIGSLEVKLPTKWSGKGKPAKIAYAKDFIIDDGGISGVCGVKNLLPYAEGAAMSGWKFSIDDFNLTVFRNKPVGAGMDGLIHLPILKDDESWKYKASFLAGGDIQFAVSPAKTSTVDLWLANARFDSTTMVQIQYIDDEFLATAVLNGEMDIKKNGLLTAEKISFQNLAISNDKDAVKSPGTWKVGAIGAKVKGFELFFKEIKLHKKMKNDIPYIHLDFGVELDLASSGEKGLKINAEGYFEVVGKVELDAQSHQRWTYEDLNIKSFAIDCSSNGNHFKGGLTFYKEDPNFGDGFYGYIDAGFKMIPNIKAAAVFGKKPRAGNPDDVYKYFFVDAFAKLSKPVTPLQINGIGGGVSWHMKKIDPVSFAIENAPKDTTKIPMNAPKSFTGATYIPDESVGLGIKLLGSFAPPKPNETVFNGAVTIEMIFNSGGGIKEASFRGVMHFMAKPEKSPSFFLTPSSIGPGVHADLMLKLDFDNDVLTGNMVGYADVAGGVVGCSGGCQTRKLGNVDMYFGKEKWYINIGRTNADGKDRISLGFDIAGQEIITDAYINIGNSIKPMPPLPDYAKGLVSDKAFANNDLERNSGSGFALGAVFKMNFGREGFVYGNVGLDLGFDLMMKDYGDAKCLNTGKTVGINGWYATGQMYVQIKGAIGIKVKNKKIPLADICAAVAMQSRGPKPFWASGGAMVKYSVLFGAIKGSAAFSVEVGSFCDLGKQDPVTNTTLPTNEPEQLIIESITPNNGATQIAVTDYPVVTFLQPIDRIKTILDPDGGVGAAFKVEIKSMLLKVDGYNTYYKSEQISDNQVRIIPEGGVLPMGKKIDLEVEAAVIEYSADGTKVIDEMFNEKRVISFTTTKLLAIPNSFVQSAYPYDGMFNYYIKEDAADRGMIRLKTDFSHLFNNVNSAYSSPMVYFYNNENLVKAVSCTYKNATNTIEFKMPNADLMTSKVYKMQVVMVDENEQKTELLTQYFRTSQFANYYEKLQNVTITKQNTNDGIKVVFGNIAEPFDDIELKSKLVSTNVDYTTKGLFSGANDIYNQWKNNPKHEYTFNNYTVCDENFSFSTYYNFEASAMYPLSANTTSSINAATYANNQVNFPTSNQYAFDFNGFKDIPKMKGEINDFISSLTYKVGLGCGNTIDEEITADDCIKAISLPKTPAINVALPQKTTFTFEYRLPDGSLTSTVEKTINY